MSKHTRVSPKRRRSAKYKKRSKHSNRKSRNMRGGNPGGMPLYYFSPLSPVIRTASQALKGGATVGAPFSQNLSAWIRGT